MNKNVLVLALMLLLVSSTASAAIWDDLFKWFNPTGEATAAVKVEITEVGVGSAAAYAKASNVSSLPSIGLGTLTVKCTGTKATPYPIDLLVEASTSKEDFTSTVQQVTSGTGSFEKQVTLGPFTDESAGLTATLTCTPKKPANSAIGKANFKEKTGKVKFVQVRSDFEVSAVAAPFDAAGVATEEVRQGVPFQVKVTVANTSTASYTGPLTVEVALQGVETKYTKTLDNAILAASGGTADFMVAVPLPPVVTATRSVPITATVDPANAVAELKEDGKNRKAGTVRVSHLMPVGQGPGPEPVIGTTYDLEPVVSYTKATNAAGQEVITFAFKVRNNGSRVDRSFSGSRYGYVIQGVPATAISDPTGDLSLGNSRLRRVSGQVGQYALYEQLFCTPTETTTCPAEVQLFTVTVTRPQGNTSSIWASANVDVTGATSSQDGNPGNNHVPGCANCKIEVAYQAPTPVDCATNNTCKVTKAKATDPTVAVAGEAKGFVRPVTVNATVTATEGSGQVVVVQILENSKGSVISKQVSVVSLVATGTAVPVSGTHTFTSNRGKVTVRVWSLDGKRKLAEEKANFNLNVPAEDNDA